MGYCFRKWDEVDKKQFVLCIAGGIFTYRLSYLSPSLFFYKGIGVLMVLYTLVEFLVSVGDPIEDQPPKKVPKILKHKKVLARPDNIPKSRLSISLKLRNPDEIDKKQFAFCIASGILVYSYSYLSPRLIFNKWISILTVLSTLVLAFVSVGDPIEDQPAIKDFERKSDRSKTRISEHHTLENSFSRGSRVPVVSEDSRVSRVLSNEEWSAEEDPRSRIPILQNLRKPNEIAFCIIHFAFCMTPGILLLIYASLMQGMIIFEWIGIFMLLYTTVQLSITGCNCRVGVRDPIEDQPVKKVFERKSDRSKTRISEHHNAVKRAEIDKKQVAFWITMGIVIYSYGYIWLGVWQTLFKCVGFSMMLAPLAALREDSGRKSHNGSDKTVKNIRNQSAGLSKGSRVAVVSEDSRVSKKAISLGEKKPRKVLDGPVLREPDSAPMLEEKMAWRIHVCCCTRISYISCKP